MTDLKDFDLDLHLDEEGLEPKGIELRKNSSGSGFIQRVKTEAEVLEELRLLQTNFIFIYGDAQAGKSAVCASLLHYIMTHGDVGSFEGRGQGDADSRDFIREAVRSMRKGRFLPRTGHDSVTLAGGLFQPVRKGFPSLPITFMEMAGEECRNLIAPADGKPFPKHIDLYLNDESLRVFFVIVVSHDSVNGEKDILLSEFVDFLRSKDPRFSGSRVLLLISKWDGYKGERSVGELVQKFLPLTYSALCKNDNAIMAYKVGKVKEVDGAPYIESFDDESPRKTLRWLYSTITGKDFMKETAWVRFWKNFQD
jgi:hypothetical protein